MTDYYVVRTIAGREFEAVKALREQAYMESYVPWVMRKRRRREEQVAYFPGYIFVRYWIPWRECDPEHEKCVRDRNGKQLLLGPVGIGGVCYPIPESELSGIAIRAAMQRIDAEPRPEAPKFKPGDFCVFKSGAFEGNEGTVEIIDGDEAEIATKIFNAVRTVKARVETLEAA
jgi:transcription antitermination factor NusG